VDSIAALSAFVGRWFALIVVVAGGIALATPDTFAAGSALVPYFLMVVMLGMGMTLRGSDFAIVARRPWALLLGVAAQYVVMPGVAWLLTQVLSCPRRSPPASSSSGPLRAGRRPTSWSTWRRGTRPSPSR